MCLLHLLRKITQQAEAWWFKFKSSLWYGKNSISESKPEKNTCYWATLKIICDTGFSGLSFVPEHIHASITSPTPAGVILTFRPLMIWVLLVWITRYAKFLGPWYHWKELWESQVSPFILQMKERLAGKGCPKSTY